MHSFKEAFKKAAKPQKEFVVLLSLLRVTKGGSAQYVLVVFKIQIRQVKKKRFW